MEIQPGKSETMTLLGQDPVRCKFVVDNKCLQRVKNFKYIGRKIFYENGRILNKN
jgi:hypothetical protein